MNELSIDVELLDQLPAKTMLKLVEKRQSAMKFLAEVARTIQADAPLFRFLEEQDIDIRIDPDVLIVTFSFTGTAERLARLWGEFRRNGYTTNERPKKGDTRFYAYWTKEGAPKLLMNFSSSVCKRVQVGTKTVEQPIYETQCEDFPSMTLEQFSRDALDGPSAAEEIPF